MRNLFHPLLFVIARATDRELARYLEFLMAENQILRARLPKRIVCTPAERATLVKLGKSLGSALKDLVTIVTPQTLRRWIKAAEETNVSTKPKRKPGRPRTAEEIRDLILLMARENHWGYGRLLGELKKLGLKPLAYNTVKNILIAAGLDPEPKRGKGSWHEFLLAHAETLWQCDFFSKRIWTPTGLRQCFVLAFLHVGTRKVFLTNGSFEPDAAWMKKAVDDFLKHGEGERLQVGHVFHDRDGMFRNGFDERLKAAGCRVQLLGYRAPNQNAYVERFVQSVKQEVLDQFVVFGQRHYDYLIAEWLDHYHTTRPHQGLENELIDGAPVVALPPVEAIGQVHCRSRLGGVIKHYYRAAA